MMNCNDLFNFNSAAMPEYDPLPPHHHHIGDIQEWPMVDSCLLDCPTEPRVDVPDLLDFDADTTLPPPKRACAEAGLKSIMTLKDYHENFNSNYYAITPKPDPLKAVVFTDEINQWIDSCLNLDPSEPCVDATADMTGTIEISSMQQPSTPSSQLVDEVALSDKSPLLMLEYDGPEKKTERVHWTPEEHRLFLTGIEKYGKGKWKAISENVVKTKSHLQIASHAQKHFLRLKSNGSDTGGKKKRKSIHDVTIDHIPDPMGRNDI